MVVEYQEKSTCCCCGRRFLAVVVDFSFLSFSSFCVEDIVCVVVFHYLRNFVVVVVEVMMVTNQQFHVFVENDEVEVDHSFHFVVHLHRHHRRRRTER